MTKTLHKDCRHCEKSIRICGRDTPPRLYCKHEDEPQNEWGMPTQKVIERGWHVLENDVESKTDCEWWVMASWHPLNRDPQLEMF